MNRIKSLSITKKMILVIFVSMLFLASVLYAISSTVLSESYTAIETQAIHKDLERAEDAIQNLYPQLRVKLNDWASWDDTYEFVSDLNQEYIDSNISTFSLGNLKINAMIFADTEGVVVYKEVIDLKTTKEIDPTEVSEYVESHRELIMHTNSESVVRGLLPLRDGPFMFTSLPILNSEGEGPSRGSLTFGIFITKDIVDEISELTHLPVEVFPYGDTSSSADVITAEQFLAANEDVFVTPLSENSVAAYSILNDYYGKPLLTLKVVTPREIYTQGKFTLSFFLMSIGVLSVLFGLILIALLHRIVVSRFIKLSETVRGISTTNDLTIRINEDVKDEIGDLAQSINTMLDKIVAAQEAEAVSKEKVRTIAAELKKRLSETKRMNEMMIDREVRMVELKNEIAELKGEE